MRKICSNCHFTLEPDEESFVRDGKVFCVPCFNKAPHEVEPEQRELVYEDMGAAMPSKPTYAGSGGIKVTWIPMKRVKIFSRDIHTGTETVAIEEMPLEVNIPTLKYAIERANGAELVRAVILDRFWKSEAELSAIAKAGIFLYFAGA